MILMKKFIYSLILSFMAIPAYCQAKNSYEITLSVSGLKDSTVYLAYHFGEKQFIKDTAQLDTRGYTKFSGLESLPHGIYMVVLPGRNYFEILIGDDQHFSAACSYPDYLNTLRFDGSEENAYFIDYQKRWAAMRQQASATAKRLQSNRQNSDSVRILSEKQKTLEDNMKLYLRQVIRENGNSLLSVLVRSMLPVEVPEFRVPEGFHNPDSLRWIKRYMYTKDHFFDNLDLTDDRLLRTPILEAHLRSFFTNVVIQASDSINPEIDKLIMKCKTNEKVFQFVSVFLFNHFRESEIMGHDAVLVKIADDIYLSGKADWVSEKFLEDLRRQVELLRNNLVGMKGKNLVMDSFSGIFVSLYDIEKEFTILYFWEPDCGHCKESTPKLKDYYEKARNEGIEIFSVCTTSDKAEWAKYIQDNDLKWINGWDPSRSTHFDFYYNVQSTPMIYILDRNKKIIAKKLSVEDIPGFINNYRKYFR